MNNSAAKNMDYLQVKLRIAARALGRANLVHAYGHCSTRLDEEHFLVCAPVPMPTVTPQEKGTVVPISGPLPDGVLGEVRIHQAIYLRNPDTRAVCRVMPPTVMTLSTLGITAKPRHGLGAYFGKTTPLWNDPRLLRNDQAAAELADMLGQSLAIVMRGNGAVVTGKSIEEAVSYSWFLEDAARTELQALTLLGGGDVTSIQNIGLLNEEEIKARQVMTGGVFERMWRFLTEGDVELNTLQKIQP